MSEALIGSLIVAVLGLIGNIVASALTSNKAQAVMETKLEDYAKATDDKITALTKTVEKHNNLVERVAVLERDNKTAFNRIDELRSDIREIQKER